jgi:glycosyltransferase involved in cell wall biosynthesis
MNILFLTTFCVDIDNEHYFTKNVYSQLCQYVDTCAGHNVQLASLFIVDGDNHVTHETYNLHDYVKIYISDKLSFREMISYLSGIFKALDVDVIHSNMDNAYEVEAAQLVSIPVVNTIHIGGIICPRGGGDGFLTDKCEICHQTVGRNCYKCICAGLPAPYLAKVIYRVIPDKIKSLFLKHIQKQVLYLTPICLINKQISERIHVIDVLKKSHLIAANYKLVDLLKLNGIPSENIHLLPHGVKERIRLPLPEIRKVKFYILSRIQYSKNIHGVLKAFKGIDPSTYELHIIGNCLSQQKSSIRYEKKIHNMAKGMNVIFHGKLFNHEIDGVIKDCHVMIHNAIFLEVYGIAIAESLSIGRPVLATRCGGAEMQVIDGYNGWLINPNSEDELRAKILHVINHKEEIVQYSGNASLPHNLRDYPGELIKIYESIIAERK